MVRFISGIVGAAFVFVLLLGLYNTLSGWITDPPARTAVEEFHLHPKDVALASNGVLGTYDQRQLQRGLQVYKEVCANCHSLKHVAFRDLTQLGYSPAQVKKFAADWGTKAKEFDPK